MHDTIFTHMRAHKKKKKRKHNFKYLQSIVRRCQHMAALIRRASSLGMLNADKHILQAVGLHTQKLVASTEITEIKVHITAQLANKVHWNSSIHDNVRWKLWSVYSSQIHPSWSFTRCASYISLSVWKATPCLVTQLCATGARVSWDYFQNKLASWYLTYKKGKDI